MEKLKVLLQGITKGNMYLAILEEGKNKLNHSKLKKQYTFGEREVIDANFFSGNIEEKGYIGYLYVGTDGLFRLEALNEGIVLIGQRNEYSNTISIKPNENTISYISPWVCHGGGGAKNHCFEDYARKIARHFKGRYPTPDILFFNGFRKRFTNQEIIKCLEVSKDIEESFKKVFFEELNKPKTDKELELEEGIKKALEASTEKVDKISENDSNWFKIFYGRYNEENPTKIIYYKYDGELSENEIKEILPCLDIYLSKSIIVENGDGLYLHIESCYPE